MRVKIVVGVFIKRNKCFLNNFILAALQMLFHRCGNLCSPIKCDQFPWSTNYRDERHRWSGLVPGLMLSWRTGHGQRVKVLMMSPSLNPYVQRRPIEH
jgi:hypothetical protein